MDIFSERFKYLKSFNKVTYQQIANYLNINLRTVQYYASGHLKPDYFGLISIADYFNVSLDYLTGRSDEKTFKISSEYKSKLSSVTNSPEIKK